LPLLTVKLHSRYVKESMSGLGNFGKVGVEKFWKLGVRVGHFTFDSATLNCKPKRYSY